MKFGILWAVLAIGMSSSPAYADEKKMEGHCLSEWKFGVTLFGDRVVPRSLGGKVVVLQYWGVGCPSCLKGFERLKKLDRNYREKGLRVVGAEIYHSGKERIASVVKKQGVGFSITDGVTGPVSVTGLPYAVVFGVDGKVIFHGHPNDEKFEKTIKLATSGAKRSARVPVKSQPALLGGASD